MNIRDKKKTQVLDLSVMAFGKIPPQSKELEEAVLGIIMLEKGVFDSIIEILNYQCFYTEAHQRIFKAMCEIQQKNCIIDLLSLVEELKFREELELVGGPYYIATLTNKVTSSANVENFAKII